MRGGRAGIISNAVKKKRKELKKYENEIEVKNEVKLMRKYGLEEVPKGKPDLEQLNDVRMHNLQ